MSQPQEAPPNYLEMAAQNLNRAGAWNPFRQWTSRKKSSVDLEIRHATVATAAAVMALVAEQRETNALLRHLLSREQV